MTHEEAKKMGATHYNDEFKSNGDVIYLRKHQGVMQYIDYSGEWSDLLFNMPCKPIEQTHPYLKPL